MKNQSTQSATVAKATRRHNTVSGNPRWKIVTEDGRLWLTGDDSQSGYVHWDELVGQQVEVRLDGDQQIVSLEGRQEP